MKVQEVYIKKFKSITDLTQAVDGNHLFVIGENGVGKSTFIQFIEIALGKSTNIPPDALGEGHVITDKDGKKYIFGVKIKDGKSVVSVTTPDGIRDQRKSALATVVGAIDFDINEFAELSKTAAGRKKQVEIFKGFLSPEVRADIEKFEAKIRTDFNDRTENSREIKAIKGFLQESPLNAYPESNLKAMQPVDTKVLLEELSKNKAHNDKIKSIKDKMAGFASDIAKNEAEIKELEVKVALLKDKNVELSGNIAKGNEWLTSNLIIDVAPTEESISKASETNKEASQAQEILKKRQLLLEAEGRDTVLSASIENQREAVANAIKDNSNPIQGLEFTEDQLLYNGVAVNPDCLSTSEIMELGVKLKMAENPELGILFIQRGESLGKARLEEIFNIANKNGWEIIMEEVRRGREQLSFEIMKAE